MNLGFNKLFPFLQYIFKNWVLSTFFIIVVDSNLNMFTLHPPSEVEETSMLKLNISRRDMSGSGFGVT